MKSRTLTGLLTEYLEQLASRRFSPHTIKQIRCGGLMFARWLREAQRVEAAEQLRRPHVEAWQKHLAAQTVRGLPLKARTLNKRAETLRGFLRYLAAKGYAGGRLAEAVETVKEPKLLPGSVLSHAQARRMLEAVATDTPAGYRNRVMLELLYTSGIRAAELVGLDVEHVDFRDSTARVTGKGSKERVVPVGRTALALLENYVRGVRPFQAREPSEKALFLDERGKRMPYYTLLRIVHACAARAGAAGNVTPHTFRRSCATELLRGGAGMYQVKELLGHESLDTLKHYAKLTIQDLKREHQRCHPREKDAEQHL